MLEEISSLINPKYIYVSQFGNVFVFLVLYNSLFFCFFKKDLKVIIYNLSKSKWNLVDESSNSVTVSNKSNYCYFDKRSNSDNFRKPFFRLWASLKDRCSIGLWYTRHKDRKFFEPPPRISSPIHKTLSRKTFKNFSPHFFFSPRFTSETLIQ